VKYFWSIVVGIPLFICGFLRSPETMLQAAGIGIGLFALGGFGSLIAPTANTTAYFDRCTGRQVTPDGKPIYTLTEDVARFGPVLGFLWCAIKFIFGIVFGGAVIGMFCYGGYSVIRLILSPWVH
jgi:hypothetical protein